MRTPTGHTRLRGATILLVLLAGCGPQTPPDVSTGEALLEIGDALNALRADNAILQAQIDSLREAVARQDTVVARLGAAVGMLPPP